MSNFYVYRHIRLDTNSTFYVGKGKRRSTYWNNIVSKYGYIVEIIEENLTEEQAFEKEIEFIQLYKSQGSCEANFTEGGDGISGLKHSRETKNKMSEAHKGFSPSKETREKIGKAHKGRKHTEEHREKLSESHKGQVPWNKGKTGIYSKETLANISNSLKGKTPSEETRKKLSKANKGRRHSKEALKKMSKANKGGNNPNARKVICTKTNKIWDCVKDAALEMGINYGTLKGWLKHKNKTTLIYYKELQCG